MAPASPASRAARRSSSVATPPLTMTPAPSRWSAAQPAMSGPDKHAVARDVGADERRDTGGDHAGGEHARPAHRCSRSIRESRRCRPAHRSPRPGGRRQPAPPHAAPARGRGRRPCRSTTRCGAEREPLLDEIERAEAAAELDLHPPAHLLDDAPHRLRIVAEAEGAIEIHYVDPPRALADEPLGDGGRILGVHREPGGLTLREADNLALPDVNGGEEVHDCGPTTDDRTAASSPLRRSAARGLRSSAARRSRSRSNAARWAAGSGSPLPSSTLRESRATPLTRNS